MKIRIVNAVDTDTAQSPAGDDHVYDDILGTEYSFRKRITSERSGVSPFETDLNDDELIEITLTDGSIWFLGADELKELGADQQRSSTDDYLDISESLFATQR